MATHYKIILEQIGDAGWTWEIRDACPMRFCGAGRLAVSGTDGEYGCFVTPERAFNDAGKWMGFIYISPLTGSRE